MAKNPHVSPLKSAEACSQTAFFINFNDNVENDCSSWAFSQALTTGKAGTGFTYGSPGFLLVYSLLGVATAISSY